MSVHPLTREECLALDAADPLAHFRAEFTLPEGLIYLDGNSLGALPVRTSARVRELVEVEWGQELIKSWNDAGWFRLPHTLGARVAPLLGAAPGQLVVCDTTSVNLFKVLSAALRLRPGRGTVLAERAAFPTDLYIVEGVTSLAKGSRLELLDHADRLDDLLDEGVAAVVLSHVDYRTGELLDMPGITRRVQAAGALMIWDVCHSVAALPIELDASGVDFAVGCTYKYLNGGPGSPAFLYVAERHLATAAQPLSGWFGHARPFAFEPGYEPLDGIGRFLTSSPSMLGQAALGASLDVWEKADLATVRAKSLALTDLFVSLVEQLDGIEVVTPREHERRGSQIALRHSDGYPVVQALIARGVVGDFRAPDLMRFGFTPLYLSYTEVWDAARHLAEVLESGEWRDERFNRRGEVT
ncbi:kynureninase [Kitasatospora sp. MMS16-BH015]|uniref:kynureninase n=1 Tax=Kitasatospora sp. MMS16-BH015 TaxID=2018025 RepID=UPI000CA3D860|nr:kynureninase [Kitasatospora sp. MMS16-BH015]AUG77020.1 kynureninase [Kitasatospora sp. MMS16-BH015]